ncbi:methionine synthase [Mycobacterium sp. M1]|uniref:Methionine synthase n=1 Tax=Mycolicibacter acidiphilus TaxID=2835306 RepID=A0ABS5RI48_9MYCO|nr:methionine synthase [Mycolicibacter acidiphilus]MBS9533972.1 methionine synthase [Mycolicibacter acidiphilus]
MSVFATGTGIGSWPGTTARSAAEVVVGELGGTLAHLVELPARGVGADLIGRAGALLVDLAIDTTTRGYRLAARPGAVTRRAISLLGEDTDAFEEAWEKAGLRGSGHPVKVQAPGPVTLAAELELANGHRVLTDPGAVRDLAASLAEGLAAHRADLARRLDTEVVVQFDEPSLPAAVAGRLAGVTALSPVPAVEESLATELLDGCAAGAGGAVLVHSCAGAIPWKVLQRSSINAVAVDAALLDDAGYDGIAEFIDSGRTAVLGLLASTAPPRKRSMEEIAQAAAAFTDRIGFPRSVLGERIGISPACGLARATPEWARTAISLSRRIAEALTADPAAI